MEMEVEQDASLVTAVTARKVTEPPIMKQELVQNWWDR